MQMISGKPLKRIFESDFAYCRLLVCLFLWHMCELEPETPQGFAGVMLVRAEYVDLCSFHEACLFTLYLDID